MKNKKDKQEQKEEKKESNLPMEELMLNIKHQIPKSEMEFGRPIGYSFDEHTHVFTIAIPMNLKQLIKNKKNFQFK